MGGRTGNVDWCYQSGCILTCLLPCEGIFLSSFLPLSLSSCVSTGKQ